MWAAPVAAYAFDGEGSENWILPTEGGMAVIGAVGLMIPA